MSNMSDSNMNNSDKGWLELPQNHKYCYRHRPDILCNRQADLRNMKELQDAMETIKDANDREDIEKIWSIFGSASGKLRVLILKGLLSQSCSPQLSAVSSIMKDLIRVDFISVLPPELSVKILCYLDSASLCRAAQVARRWKELADDDVVWHKMCEQHIDKKCTKCGWGLPLLEKKRLKDSQKEMQERVAEMSSKKRKFDESECSLTALPPIQVITPPPSTATISTSSSIIVKKTRPWKDVYSERYIVEQNWRHGRYKMLVFQDANDRENSSILTLQFDDQYLMTGSYDGKVKVWDVESGKIVRTLSGHVRAVNALKFDSSKIITGSSDCTVRIWNYKTGEIVSTFTGHERPVLCIDFDGKLIASGAEDNNIKVWNFETKSCFTLRGHEGFVHGVKIHASSGTLYSSSEDCTIRMWCLETKQCLKVFGGDNGDGGHIAQVQTVLPLKLDHLEGEEDYHHREEEDTRKCELTHLLTCSFDNTIKLWDIETGKCIRTLFGHIEGIWDISADTFRIVSASHDNTVKVWDLQSGKCWHTFNDHEKPATCICLSDTRFASGSDDGKVKMYCFD